MRPQFSHIDNNDVEVNKLNAPLKDEKTEEEKMEDEEEETAAEVTVNYKRRETQYAIKMRESSYAFKVEKEGN
jgi:hypothetical protein